MAKQSGFHKKPSKRVTLKRKYKIEKKVREHNRKVKKLARKNNKGKLSKARTPIEMPRSAPFSLEWNGSTHTTNREKRLLKQNEDLAEIVTELAPAFDIDNPTLDQIKAAADSDMNEPSVTVDNEIVSKTSEMKRNQLIGLQLNKERKNKLKLIKRNKKRGEKKNQESEINSMDVNEGDDYDFETDFAS